ncbi:alpha/beta hydrolase [Catenulispora sp. NL8]|uniref:Alpha/beta hydrolase n=1 Tax=Catenulispora pinistramenti TaxID=2705254 RepID=A0ABS5L8J0_9ACTN|nr:alpha/beta hydrolase [Catenulispora pinistramenti]MBS2554673.1 alpha/beta hydrolase [Catenulispora pinistramenti]
MPLHPQVQAHLDRLAAANLAGLHTVTPDVARAGARRLTAASVGEPEPVAEVTERVLGTDAGDVPVRIYRPSGVPTGATGARPLPVVVFFHGGGYVLGDLDSHDGLARALANGSQSVVVSVGYPLAPENKFPDQPNAGYAATAWIADHAAALRIDPSRIAVAGDSAGGNLAAVVTLKARANGGPYIGFQLLIYPDLDFRRTNRSITELAGQYGNITREAQQWFMNHYLTTEAEKLNPLVSPLLEPDLTALPPAHIITAEYDALRDEGEEYGRRLAAAGVPVTVKRYDGMIHEFLRHPFDDAKVAIDDATAALRRFFDSGTGPRS